jgi:hypothetical protein
MEINWGILVVSAISALVCTIPFFIDYRNRSKKKRALLDVLENLARQNACSISKHDCGVNLAMGADTDRNFVFFVRQHAEGLLTFLVDLSGFRSCEAGKSMKNTSTASVIEQVELRFIPINSSAALSSFVLYKEDRHTRLNGEWQLAEKWATEINRALLK